MAGQALQGIPRILMACTHSLAGLRAAWTHEEAFRQECTLALFGIPLALLLGQSGVERALLVATLLIVVIIELINTAIEATIDRIGLEYHELSARAKDVGSAAVMVSFILFLLVWILILIP